MSAALVFLLAAAGLAASPGPEVMPSQRDFTIGVLYTTLDTGCFSHGVRYQRFDRSCQRVLVQLARGKVFGLREYNLGSDPGMFSTAVSQMASEQVSGAIVCQTHPLALGRFVQRLRDKEIPEVLHGVRNLRRPLAPALASGSGKRLPCVRDPCDPRPFHRRRGARVPVHPRFRARGAEGQQGLHGSSAAL